jgi:hypothetical protein
MKDDIPKRVNGQVCSFSMSWIPPRPRKELREEGLYDAVKENEFFLLAKKRKPETGFFASLLGLALVCPFPAYP